ncbi:hypothetical protein AB0E70_33035, partial [Streptomyces murinus]|uniref:hypothetical protein n=1 Tax=Streptomyces murinus TaxID=33900 RepID=UPI0033E1A74C
MATLLCLLALSMVAVRPLVGSGGALRRPDPMLRYRSVPHDTDRYSPYRKMLAALWRESPVPSL